jgi:hypothetical protein
MRRAPFETQNITSFNLSYKINMDIVAPGINALRQIPVSNSTLSEAERQYILSVFGDFAREGKIGFAEMRTFLKHCNLYITEQVL